MPERGLVAYDPNGRIFVLVHDDELLVHDGDSEGPLWREALGEPIAGVAIAGDEIVAVGEAGAVRRFTFLHREQPRSSLGAAVRAFAVRADGTVAAAHEDHVSVLRRNDLAPVPLYHRGVTAMAWSRDGTRLAVARSASESEHTITLLDGGSFEPLPGSVSLEQPVRAMCATPKAFLAGSGDRLVRVVVGGEGGLALEHVTRATGRKITDVACAADGARFALQLERSQVVVLADPPSDTVLDVKYPERVCCGVAFGPRPWIAIALAGGDGNKVNPDTGAMHRSDTHPGRQHNRWLVSFGGAFQKRQQAAAAAGAAPAKPPADPDALERELAKQRALDEAERELARTRGDDGSDLRLMLRIGMIVLGLLLGLARACSHTHHY